MKLLAQPTDRLYRVKVRGGGSFLYDLYDLCRFTKALYDDRDSRPISIRPVRHFWRWYW